MKYNEIKTCQSTNTKPIYIKKSNGVIRIDDTKTSYDYTNVVGKALLQYRTGVKDFCASYDPFGLCNIMECLYCDNCYYKITMENGELITNTDVDLNTLNNSTRGFEDDNHEILFYDYVPKIDNLFSYLFDENSEFKVLRLSDNMVMNDYTKKQNKLVKTL